MRVADVVGYREGPFQDLVGRAHRLRDRSGFTGRTPGVRIFDIHCAVPARDGQRPEQAATASYAINRKEREGSVIPLCARAASPFRSPERPRMRSRAVSQLYPLTSSAVAYSGTWRRCAQALQGEFLCDDRAYDLQQMVPDLLDRMWVRACRHLNVPGPFVDQPYGLFPRGAA